MRVKKFFGKLPAALIVFGALIITPKAYAEVQTYIGTGDYVIGNSETIDKAKKFAKKYAERNAQEQAGVYLESYSFEQDFELLKDEIRSISRGIIKIKDVQYDIKILDAAGGIKCTATVKAEIDSDDMLKWMNQSIDQRRQINSQYEELEKNDKAQEKRLKALEKQSKTSKKNSQEEAKIKAEFEREDKILESNNKVEDGWKSWRNNDYVRAEILFSDAAKLDPTNSNAYYGQGVAYDNLNQNDKAIECFNKTIELNPNFFYAYNSRGKTYFNLQQPDRAIADFSIAIQLNPNFDSAYNNRGYIYSEQKRYREAIND